VPAIGFAMGIERVLALSELGNAAPTPGVYLAPMTDAARARALSLGKQLRRAGVFCEVDARGLSVKAMLRRANGMKAALAVLIGDDELANGVITVKDLARSQQDQISLDTAARELAKRLGTGAGTDD
jgi:histidyl-tRNA synthetase